MFGIQRGISRRGADEAEPEGIAPYSRFEPRAARTQAGPTYSRFDTDRVAPRMPPAKETPPRATPQVDVQRISPDTAGHLYASTPISTSVLRRALPGRFAAMDRATATQQVQMPDDFEFDFGPTRN